MHLSCGMLRESLHTAISIFHLASAIAAPDYPIFSYFPNIITKKITQTILFGEPFPSEFVFSSTVYQINGDIRIAIKKISRFIIRCHLCRLKWIVYFLERLPVWQSKMCVNWPYVVIPIPVNRRLQFLTRPRTRPRLKLLENRVKRTLFLHLFSHNSRSCPMMVL